MHLMSCEHPIRVYNKYIDKFIWVPCNKCNSCKNRRAKRWTDACERERSISKFTLFVTLTYDELSLPLYNATGGFDDVENTDYYHLKYLVSTRQHDNQCMLLNSELFDEDCDKVLFYDLLKQKGIPYASRTDIQLFHKRLNKFFHDKITNKYQNFRYFVVSEYGSTTLRPHFHALYFVNDMEVARNFQDGISSCWKFGRLDCQFVENSACSYVAQYINKLYDMPSFYKADEIRPFFLFSRNPIIGDGCKLYQTEQEIFDSGTVQTLDYSSKFFRMVQCELDKGTENRLYPKCPFFSQISHSMRVELYAISDRFSSERGFRGFRERVEDFLTNISVNWRDEFVLILRKMVDDFSDSGEQWLKRLYYLSRKVLKNALRLGYSISSYVKKVDEYYKNKELHLINKMYEFQQNYMDDSSNDSSVDDLVLMYPEYLHDNGFTIGDFLSQYVPRDVIDQRSTADFYAYSNKRTHFKNMYLDSLKEKNNKLFVSLKNFYYAKKCYEVVEAIAPSRA